MASITVYLVTVMFYIGSNHHGPLIVVINDTFENIYEDDGDGIVRVVYDPNRPTV